MKKFVTSLAVLCLATPLATLNAAENPAKTNAGAGAKPDDLFTNTVIAKGKGVSVTRAQLDEILVTVKANAAAQGRPIMPDDVQKYEQQILDGLISRQLLLSKATDADKAKGKEQFDALVKKIKTNNNLTDDEFDKKLSQQLTLTGQTKEQWQKQGIEEQTIRAVIDREVKVDVTDEQAKKFYDERPGDFEQPESVRAAHILLSTKDPNDPNPNPSMKKDLPDDEKEKKRKQAEDLLKRARAGEDFAKLAKQYSEDPGSKDKGGEYTFSKGQFMPEFEAAAFSLNTNQISDIVSTVYGYHIIKLYEKIPAKTEPFSGPDTKTTFRKADGQYATIRDVLTDEAMRTKIPDFLKQLKKDADVQILDERLKPTEEPDLGLPPMKPSKPESK
jgi:parvulin-like peptidyl-prolyl isomerase